jgi:hypothetical protein
MWPLVTAIDRSMRASWHELHHSHTAPPRVPPTHTLLATLASAPPPPLGQQAYGQRPYPTNSSCKAATCTHLVATHSARRAHWPSSRHPTAPCPNWFQPRPLLRALPLVRCRFAVPNSVTGKPPPPSSVLPLLWPPVTVLSAAHLSS